MTPTEIVRAFWDAMATNDFAAAARWLAEDFEGYWPQSGEITRGRANFAALNTHYPAHGIWTFDVQRLVADGPTVVSDVAISDGTQHARAVTFHETGKGLILRQTEYWPDPFDPPAWRAHLVETKPF
ncbi:nuclear transport factor 2 family protein [Pontivivens insulae]|uniref:SnoaL-like domain-containing protein n=1 Tax=Pontivivens insulae TaxID=1639689 RepID=A0A2R8AB52_9RHOB|nr:nuclear transport factor 2 family protein [Pontivivens insulae]RED13188.1 limonene-1,2-epoxide hydrolase [Pontivivens insulae]SPF29280.1 hypothetical protein POI8812_01588 [Pontivivens insulae]